MFLRNGLEPWHLLIVAIVLILLFGSRKLPDTARALGKSLRILKSETRAMEEDGQRPAGACEPGREGSAEPGPPQAAPGDTTSGRPPRPAR